MSASRFEVLPDVEVKWAPRTVPNELKFPPTLSNCRCRYSTRTAQLRVNAHSRPAPAAQPEASTEDVELPPVNVVVVAGQAAPTQFNEDVVFLPPQAQPPLPYRSTLLHA